MASLEKPHVNEADVVVDEKDRKHVFVEGDISLEQRTVEARVRRKVDWRLIPILGILYSIAGLDRVNLSNARVAGMNQDLRFDVGNRYSIALLVFFITYFLFELPTTLALRPVGPKILLNGLVFSLGIVMLGMGFANDWRVIVACRMLIGIFEAGFLPCCIMALWYMINLFISAFGNILAYAIIKLDGAH
ncbi:High-affinity nicotinic acid transporter, partial [Colletotrichum sp. SAR 10_96]